MDRTRSVSSIFVIKKATGWWLAHVNWIHNKHSIICILNLIISRDDGDEEPEEEPSSEDHDPPPPP